MSYMKIKHNQHKKHILEQKAVQDESNKPKKSPIQQVQQIQDQERSSFDKAASTNTVQLAAETNNESAENFSDDNLSSSSKDMLDSEMRSGQIDVQNLHTCQTCKKTFPSKSSLNKHMRSHKTEDVTYACDVCRKHFPKLITMQQHRRLHTTAKISIECAENSDNLSSSSKDMLDSESSVQVDDQEFYACQLCQKTFDRKSSLTNHMRSHQQEITYACDICGKRFARLTTMQQHRGLHTAVSTNPAKLASQTSNGSAKNFSGDNPNSSSKDLLGSEQCSIQFDDQGLYKCQTCQKEFVKRSSLTNHMRSHQARELAFACNICGTRFSRLNTMQQHREQHGIAASTKSAEHLAPETRNDSAETSDDNLSWNSEDTYTCQICQRSFDMKSSLSNHMRSHKSEETTYPCDICGKSFSQLTSMQQHRRLHTGETPYLCKVCKKQFRTSAALSCHKRTHSDNMQKCEYCNKEFVYNFAYEAHIRSHTGEKPFTCEVCNKKFSQTSALNRHMLIHKAIAPFSCDVCSRKFRQRSELKVHMRNHTGERPYPCKTCNRGFTQKSSLVTHMKAHIKKERKRKLVASKEAAVKVKAKPEVVLVKEEREEIEESCEEPGWVEIPEEPVRVKVEKLKHNARSEEPQEDFFVEVPVINQESFEVPLLEASNT